MKIGRLKLQSNLRGNEAYSGSYIVFIRSTAKKFLAAANFLQIMSIFEKYDAGNDVCINSSHT